MPAGNVMITATLTHSGPQTVDTLSNESDPAVPRADPQYVEQLEDGIVRAAVRAFRNARPAEIGFAAADGSCIFRFALDVGMVALTGTTSSGHMRADLEVLDFRLEPEEIERIESIEN